MDKAIITTSNLAIGYSTKTEKLVLASGINIKLNAGKLISLVGPNGVGKSTLLRTLCGLQPAIEGEVRLNNLPFAQLSPQIRAQQLALVLTEKIPMSNLTVFELVALGRQPYTNWLGQLSEDDKNQINNAIRLTEVDSFLDRKHYAISDGQLQRVLIARALAQNTPWMVLDEPTSALDVSIQKQVLLLLQRLQRERGLSYLLITHDMAVIRAMAHQVLVMKAGRVLESGPVSQVLDQPRHPYTQQLVAAAA